MEKLSKLLLSALFLFPVLCFSFSNLFGQQLRIYGQDYNTSAPCARNVNCPEGQMHNFMPRNCTVGIGTQLRDDPNTVRLLGTATLLNYDVTDVDSAGRYRYHYLVVLQLT